MAEGREGKTELYRRTAVIDSTGQFTDGFTITIKLCSRGKLYSWDWICARYEIPRILRVSEEVGDGVEGDDRLW